MSEWYQDLPYGPLTRDDYDRLAMSFYSSFQTEEQAAATQRDIGYGDIAVLGLRELGLDEIATSSEQALTLGRRTSHV